MTVPATGHRPRNTGTAPDWPAVRAQRMRSLAYRQPVAAALLATLAFAAIAEETAAPPDIKTMCPSVVATVTVGKVECTAALCNTGSSQDGMTGLLARVMARDSIDAASFGSGVAAMLATALKKTGCFDVFDAAASEALRKDMEAIGRPQATAPAVDYLIKVAVTKAERVVDESNFVVYKKQTATSTLSLDTKLVQAERGSVLVAGSYEASTDRTSSGVSIPFFKQSNSAARTDSFTEVARDAVTKAAIGITGQILTQVSTRPPSPAGLAPAQASAAVSVVAPE